MSELIGIYGGSFSPPHRGHISAVKGFSEAIKPDKLLIIPTYEPPHKVLADGVSALDRLAMCRLAFSDIPRVEVCDLEILREGKSYTSDTLRALAAPNRELAFLIGTDMMLTLDAWHEPEVIFSLADLYCVRRENDAEMTLAIAKKNAIYSEKFGKTVRILDTPIQEVSSTEIRETLSRGETPEYLTPAVLAYIRERGLYGYGR